MECGNLGHFAFQCPLLQGLGRHPNLPGDFGICEDKLEAEDECFHDSWMETNSGFNAETSQEISRSGVDSVLGMGECGAGWSGVAEE